MTGSTISNVVNFKRNRERMQHRLDTLPLKEDLIMDHYRILGIPKEADEEQIKQAYRRKAKKYHPDLNPDDPVAEARFKEIVEAYETLSDREKRRAYDRKREAARGYDPSADKARTKGRGSTPVQPVDLEGLARSMERYFGSSYHKTSGVAQGSGQAQKNKDAGRGKKKNPLDVTDMFEAYMGWK